MKRMIFLAVMIAALNGAALSQVRYSPYHNSRWNFDILYPSNLLKMQPPPANNDGRTFRSGDGLIEMRAWAGFNVLDRTLAESLDDAISNQGVTVTYRSVLKNGFAFSGLSGGDIVYWRTWRAGTGDQAVDYTFLIRYPASKKNVYDAVVNKVVKSFKYN